MKLRILTFNLFFDEVARSVRMKAIGRLVDHFRPAVIGFQEVTRDALRILKTQQWAKFYDCSVDTAPPFQEAYFVALFSALPVKSLETHPFANTGMGRELVIMQVEPIPGKTLFVGTSHLESLPQFAAPRVSQLKESLTLLRDRVNNAEVAKVGDKRQRNSGSSCLGAVFMGDTNLMKADMKLLDRRLAAFADVDVELAKSGRSKCRDCGDVIEKGVVRVGKMMKSTVTGGKTMEIRVWFHKDCFLGAVSTTDDEKKLVKRLSSKLQGEEPDQNGEELDLVGFVLFDCGVLGSSVVCFTFCYSRQLWDCQEGGKIYGCRCQEIQTRTDTHLMAHATLLSRVDRFAVDWTACTCILHQATKELNLS
eukprot:jgi/Phyca11/103517/e_gw1.8.293.1